MNFFFDKHYNSWIIDHSFFLTEKMNWNSFKYYFYQLLLIIHFILY